MVEPRVMPMYEGLRSSNLGDEEEQEQEGVHDDRPAMDAIGDDICKKTVKIVGSRKSAEEEGVAFEVLSALWRAANETKVREAVQGSSANMLRARPRHCDCSATLFYTWQAINSTPRNRE